MEPFYELKHLWQEKAGQQANPSFLRREDAEKIIAARIKKEKKGIAAYFWLALSWQILIYSFACYLLVSRWGNEQVMLLCAAGALLYIPFTIVLIRKCKAMYQPARTVAADIRSGVCNQYELLTQFFNFKKRFDRIAIPVSCFVLTAILFALYVPGGIESNLPAGIIIFLTWLLIFSVAAWFENKKHFVRPLRHFEWILEDMGKNA